MDTGSEKWWEEDDNKSYGVAVAPAAGSGEKWWEEDDKRHIEAVAAKAPVLDDDMQEEIRDYSSYKPEFGVYPNSVQSRRNIYSAFTGNDPLSFIDDKNIRDELDLRLMLGENPDLERKKWALAAYFSCKYQQKLTYCYDNLPLFLDEYYGKDDFLHAYEEIRKSFQASVKKELLKDALEARRAGTPQVTQGKWFGDKIAERSMAALEIGLSNVAESVYNAVATVGEFVLNGGGAVGQGYVNRTQAKSFSDKVRMIYKDLYGRNVDIAQRNMDKPENWFTNSDGVGDFTVNLWLSLVENAPSIIVDAALATKGGAGLTAIGMYRANDAYYEISDENPEMPEWKKLLYAGLVGTVNAVGEKVTAGFFKGGDKIVTEGVKKGIAAAVKSTVTAAGKEGLQEGAETIAENGVDIIFGRRGDLNDTKAVLKELMRGVPEAMMIGGITGGAFDRMSSIDKAKAEDRARGMIQNKIAELNAKEDLSDQEKIDLEVLKLLEDTDDTNELLKTVVEEFEQAQLETDENGVEQNVTEPAESRNGKEQDGTVPAESRNGNERDLTNEEIDELLIKKSEDAEKRMRMKNRLGYNPQDVRDEVRRASNYFTDVRFMIVDSWDGLPFGISANHKGRAFTDLATGDIYINASKVRPNDVFEVMLHEVVGHKGLRGIVPEAQLDAFLDEVYASHYNDEDFQNIARTYFPDKVREFQDDEGIYYETVLEDAADQRVAAEEYLAHLAQKNTKKPSWWKQFLNKIKMWWSGTRWGKEYPVTTDQIEALLARAGRRMRKHWWNRRSQVVEGKDGIERSGTELSGTGDVRFAVPFTEGQSAHSVIVPSLPVNLSDTKEIRKYFFDHFKGREVEIKSDGRLVLFTRQGLEDTLKRRGEHRKSFSALDSIIEESYPVGYETVDERHKEKRPDLKGQFVYAALLDINGEHYIAAIKLDDTAADNRAYFKDISIKKRSLYVGQTQDFSLEVVDPSADRNLTVQQLIDFVKRDFSNSPFFSETIPGTTKNNGVLRRGTEGVRFSVEEYSDSDHRDIVAILQPFVGQVVDLKESEYRKYLLDHGVDIPEEDAKAFAVEAMRENQKLARQRGIRKRDNWLYENYPLFRMVAEVAGDNFIINPEYTSSEGEHFTGSWIAPEFVKYSGPAKKFEEFSSNKKYRQYLAAREKALKHAKGTDLSDIAEAIARKTGKDSLTLKEEIKDFFRDLKKKEFYGRYTQWKKDQAFEDQALRDAAMAEWQQQEKFRIEDEVISILQNGLEVDQEWITQNRAVYKELYRQLFSGKEAPHTPGKRDLEAINAALKQKSGDAAVFAEAYKVARAQLETEFDTKLSELKERVLSSKADAVKLQREALVFAQQHLEKENRNEFAKSIVKLMEYSNVPNTKYPQGRRKAEFDKLLERMVERGQEVRKKAMLEKIQKRLGQLGEKVDGGRKVRGLRDIATQKKLNRIIEISRMDAGMVNMEITKYQEVLEQKIGSGESTVEEEYQIAILNMYGNMEEKSADELQTAYNELQLLARTGKNNLLDQIEKRAAQDEFDRNEFWNAVNGMKRYSSTELSKLENDQNRKKDLKRYMDQNYWQSLSLDGILEAVALFSDKENNVVQRVREMAHKADLKKKTMNLRNGEDVQNFLKETLKTDSRFVVSDTIGKWRELKSDTGVFRFVPDPEEKQFKYEVLSVEDARKLLQKHDSGQMELPDYEAEAIRQQLVTFDRKVKYDVPAEYKDGATEKLLKEIEKENNDAESEPKVVIPKPTFNGGQEELQLSQMKALYLKLMWDQKDVKFKMHYNGYSEKTMQQIDSFLLPEVKAFGEWMREQLEADRAKISEVYEEMYFAAFPKNEMYFPAVFRSNRSNVKSGAVDITQNGAAEGSIAYTPGALKVRVYHLNDVVDADALTVFQNHRLVMNHFVSHAPVARKMRSIFLNKDVENAIKMKHGNDAFNELKDGLQDFINGGNKDVESHSITSMLYSNAIRAKMDFNVFSGVKQTAGWISYSQEIPIDALMSGMKYSLSHRKEVFETLGHTDYFIARWNGGGNAELRLLLDQSGKVGSKKEEILRMLDRGGSLATRSGDAFSVLFGGFAVYKYHYDNLIKRGVPEAEARKQALLKWEMASERTQQSSNVFLLNKFQRGGGMAKVMTTFMSNQILMWNNNATAVYKALKYDDKSSWKKAGMGVGALTLSSLAMSAFDLIRDYDDDYEFTDMIWNLLADSVVGFGPVGSTLSSIIQLASDGYRSTNFLISDLEGGVKSLMRLKNNDKASISDNKFNDAVKILQALGYIIKPIAPVAAMAREGRKWWRIFDRDDKKKKKKRN